MKTIENISVWKKALRDAYVLFLRESSTMEYVDEDTGTNYAQEFSDSAKACQDAETIFDIEKDKYANEIVELQNRINAIEAKIRKNVADQLRNENSNKSQGRDEIARAIENNDIQSILNW